MDPKDPALYISAVAAGGVGYTFYHNNKEIKELKEHYTTVLDKTVLAIDQIESTKDATDANQREITRLTEDNTNLRQLVRDLELRLRRLEEFCWRTLEYQSEPVRERPRELDYSQRRMDYPERRMDYSDNYYQPNPYPRTTNYKEKYDSNDNPFR